jgi:hypothetical protein
MVIVYSLGGLGSFALNFPDLKRTSSSFLIKFTVPFSLTLYNDLEKISAGRTNSSEIDIGLRYLIPIIPLVAVIEPSRIARYPYSGINPLVEEKRAHFPITFLNSEALNLAILYPPFYF